MSQTTGSHWPGSPVVPVTAVVPVVPAVPVVPVVSAVVVPVAEAVPVPEVSVVVAVAEVVEVVDVVLAVVPVPVSVLVSLAEALAVPSSPLQALTRRAAVRRAWRRRMPPLERRTTLRGRFECARGEDVVSPAGPADVDRGDRRRRRGRPG